jgi:hypothetical protein
MRGLVQDHLVTGGRAEAAAGDKVTGCSQYVGDIGLVKEQLRETALKLPAYFGA